MNEQKYNKEHVDNKRSAKNSSIGIGDHILVRQDKRNKLTPNFNKTPYVVTHKVHSRVTARNSNGHNITRNVSQLKRIPKPKTDDVETEDDDLCADKHKHDSINDNNNAEQPDVRRSSRVRSRPDRYGQSVYD
jgi:hypothetical protein